MMSLELALRSKKLLADFDAPSPAAMDVSVSTDPGDECRCAKCDGDGVLYHDLPGSYSREPCGCTALLAAHGEP